MSISVVPDANSKTTQIVVSNQFDFSLHQTFRDAYRTVSTPGAVFIVDLARATYMDSSALGMILLLKEHADKLSGKVIISSPNESVLKILKIANFDQFVTIQS